jgi:hypothetical protein
MPPLDHDIPDSSKEALRRYILELDRDYYPWYNRASRRLKWWWGLGQTTALLAGVLASIIAAAAKEETFSHFGFLRTALIVLPIVGALASALLAQTRARELFTLRERGRETMQTLISRAEADYALASADPERLAKIHANLINAVSRLEREQAATFFSTAPGGATADPAIIPPNPRPEADAGGTA